MANLHGGLSACLLPVLVIGIVLAIIFPLTDLVSSGVRTPPQIAIGLGSKDFPLPITWSPATRRLVIRHRGQPDIIHQFRDGKPDNTDSDFDVDRNEKGDYQLLIKDVAYAHAGVYDYEYLDDSGHYSHLNVTVVGKLACKNGDGPKESSFCSVKLAGPVRPIINTVDQNSREACDIKFHQIDGVRAKAVCEVPERHTLIGCEVNFGEKGSYRDYCSFGEADDQCAHIIARLDSLAADHKIHKWLMGILLTVVLAVAIGFGVKYLPRCVDRFRHRSKIPADAKERDPMLKFSERQQSMDKDVKPAVQAQDEDAPGSIVVDQPSRY